MKKNYAKVSVLYRVITDLSLYIIKAKNWLFGQGRMEKTISSFLVVLITTLFVVLFSIIFTSCSLTSKIRIEQNQGDQYQKTEIDYQGSAQPLTLIINPLTLNYYASSSSFSSRS